MCSHEGSLSTFPQNIAGTNIPSVPGRRKGTRPAEELRGVRPCDSEKGIFVTATRPEVGPNEEPLSPVSADAIYEEKKHVPQESVLLKRYSSRHQALLEEGRMGGPGACRKDLCGVGR